MNVHISCITLHYANDFLEDWSLLFQVLISSENRKVSTSFLMEFSRKMATNTIIPLLTPYLSHSHKSASNLVRSVAATVLEKNLQIVRILETKGFFITCK